MGVIVEATLENPDGLDMEIVITRRGDPAILTRSDPPIGVGQVIEFRDDCYIVKIPRSDVSAIRTIYRKAETEAAS